MVIGLPPQCVTLQVSVLPSHWDGDWSSTSMCYPPSQYLTLPARRQPQELVPQGTQCWCGWQQTPSPLCWRHSRSGESANTSTAVSLVWLLLNSQLSLKMVCMCSGKPIIMNSTSSLRRPPSVYIIGFQCWSDRRWPFFLLGRLLSTSSVYASLLQVMEGVRFFLALCPHVESWAPQHFRSSRTWATCEGCFACQSQALQHFRSSRIRAISEGCFTYQSSCLVIILDSSISRAVNQCESHEQHFCLILNLSWIINFQGLPGE